MTQKLCTHSSLVQKSVLLVTNACRVRFSELLAIKGLADSEQLGTTFAKMISEIYATRIEQVEFSKVPFNMKTSVIVGAGLIAILLSLLFFWRTDVEANAESKRSFVLNIDLDKFRQILVRTDATASIVEHGGMKLLRESVESVDVDLTNDRRPLLNALIGQSKATVAADKRLTVELSDPTLDTHELDLYQDTKIQPDKIHVHTKSIGPSGKLRSYVTTLEAVKNKENTLVTITVNLSVDLRISPFFSLFAKSRVQNAAAKTLTQQESAIRDLVSRFSGNPIVIPTTGSLRLSQ